MLGVRHYLVGWAFPGPGAIARANPNRRHLSLLKFDAQGPVAGPEFERHRNQPRLRAIGVEPQVLSSIRPVLPKYGVVIRADPKACMKAHDGFTIRSVGRVRLEIVTAPKDPPAVVCRDSDDQPDYQSRLLAFHSCPWRLTFRFSRGGLPIARAAVGCKRLMLIQPSPCAPTGNR